MASSTERIGVNHCGEIAERNNWMFREQPFNDIGIDAHMEFVEFSGKPKQLLALQIKSGESWFKEEKEGCVIFRDINERQYNYWTTNSLPCFIARGRENKSVAFPYCIYSTSERRDREYRFLFSGTTDINEPIAELKKWGNQLDQYLISEKEFYQLDYLCNALFDLGTSGENTYHYMKLYSLCAMFLEKDKETELDYKLPCLMDLSIPASDRVGMAELMRKIRNKIAHGDFEKLNELLECYAQKYMDGKFWFDYSEYTRSSWVLLHISCKLEEILKSLINLMLEDHSKVIELRNMKQ